MFVRATCFSYIDFLDIDGLINLEVGNENVQLFETERLRHTRALRESTSFFLQNPNRPVGVYQNRPSCVGAKIYALQNARELSFEWGIGENVGVRSCASGKIAAGDPPSIGHARRYAGWKRRVSPPPRCWGAGLFLSHLSGKRRSKCAHRPKARRRRFSPFPPRVSTRVSI